MIEEEKRLLVAFRSFLEIVRGEAPAYLKGVESAVETLGAMLQDHRCATDNKYQFARRIEAMFGGMGSVNDFPWSEEGERMKEALYQAVQDALRVYWAQLGHESNDPSLISQLPAGARVRKVEGKTIYIDRDGKRHTVSRKDTKSEWLVATIHPPDISGMPLYTIRNGSKYQLARHDALQRIDGF